MLKSAETRALLERARGGDKTAREELISGNLRLVLSVIQKFAGRGESMDDLFQVGCIGLIKAVDCFDLSQNVQFSTYGVPMIAGELRRFLRDHSAIRVSRSMRDTAYKVLQAKERLTAADGSEQTLPEKPALLASGVTDEAAAAAEAALSNAQKLIDAQAAIDQANASLAEAQTELQDAQAALDADSENADLLAARDAAQAKIDELNQTIADNQAYLDANAPQPEETAQPEATEAPAE